MKRFDDCLVYKQDRMVELKPEFVQRVYKQFKINKGLSSESSRLGYFYLQGMVGNLIEAAMLQRNLVIRLTTGNPTPLVKHRILDALKAVGYIKEIRKGYYYKDSKLSIPKTDLTKVDPSLTAIESFDSSRVKTSRTWSVIVRDGDREEKLYHLEDQHKILQACSRVFQPRVNIPIKRFTRIFTGHEESGGRIYSNYQQMSKDDRNLIRIDGEETTELDYRYNQIRMLFFLVGAKDEGDPYDGFDIPRDEVKRALNTMMNSTNPKRVFCDRRFGAYFKWTTVKADKFISDVNLRFPYLSKYLGSGIGMLLQKLEGDIALDIMSQSLYNSSVVLPVHDSFIVKKSLSSRFESMMDETWLKVMEQTKNCQL